MIETTLGVGAAILFVLLVTALHAWLEQRLDKKATQVFDADGTRSPEELEIIHKNQLPIRGLLIVMMALAADTGPLLPTLALLGVGITAFWILFDIFCAVLWLGKPWYYAGEPPPYGLDPYIFFGIKCVLFLICLIAYLELSL